MPSFCFLELDANETLKLYDFRPPIQYATFEKCSLHVLRSPLQNFEAEHSCTSHALLRMLRTCKDERSCNKPRPPLRIGGAG